MLKTLLPRKAKRAFTAITALLLAAVVLVAAAPAEAKNLGAEFYLGRKSYNCIYIKDGQRMRESRPMDVEAFIENGRTYVPVRYLAYALGVAEKDVRWDEASQTVTLAMEGTTVRLQVGSRTLYVNGQPREMDVTPLLRDGRVFLPARFVAEAFGYEVKWVNEAMAVVVYLPESQQAQPQPQPQPQPQQPQQPTAYKISWDDAVRGTLQPPPGAVPAPDLWGFPPRALRMEFKVGSRYADVTWADGSKGTVDLGTECVIAGNPTGTEFLRNKYPQLYNEANSFPVPGADYGAFYVPIIPVAEAFGVPRENIVWDGEHLALFGYYGDVRNYRLMKAGTRDSVGKAVGGKPEVMLTKSDFPLFVKDGVPMVGINSVSDVSQLLFAVGAGYQPGLVKGVDDIYHGGWDYETGKAEAGIKLMSK
ncbi:copper amine oxidase N-terminal domain-containing protein [Desulfovirgula thermocuniculi]|uniref:copper amine oxidase N-terminal domain-containing protein n=1 Tax=Desulfovirgula thermocuniculi TaxID=348842 RepID=UPI0004234DE2|nr:copper amine oxidase N-terminal domain-containing protein [Desulfovirgula thermocuniculi]